MEHSGLSFSNKLSATIDRFFIIFQAGGGKLLLDGSQGLFESDDFIIFLIFDLI